MNGNTKARRLTRGWALNRAGAGLAALAAVGLSAGVTLAAGPASVHPGHLRAFAVGTFSAYGKVSSVSAGAIILTAANGDLIAVNVPSGVHVRNGLTPSSLASVVAGDYAQATFRWTANGLVATAVTYDSTGFATGMARPMFGRVSSTGPNGLVITLANGKTRTVSLLPGAKVVTGGKPSSLASITAGDFARLSVRSGNGATDATAVWFSAMPLGLARKAIGGTVTSVAGTTIAITTAGGRSIRATVGANASVTALGKPVALSGLASGTKVRLVGWWFDRVFYARRVIVGTATAPASAGTGGATSNG